MKNILKFVIMVVILLSMNMLNAQEKVYKDKVVLKNGGSILVGVITDYVPGDQLTIELKTGNKVIILDSQIKKVIMYEGQPDKGERVFAPLKVSKIFNETQVSVLTSVTGSGVSIAHNVMYQASPLIALGAGLGLDNYYSASGREIFPLFANAKINLMQGRSAPYVGVKAGYGFAFTNEDENITSATGGFMANPYFGIRIGSRGLIVNIFSGLKFQKADYIVTNSWDTRTEDILFRRLEIGISVMF